MAMKRTSVDGKTLNTRTADMLALWQYNCLTNFYVLQGSYNKGGVKNSAGTHDGGGAVDLSVSGWSNAHTDWVVKQGRLAGFAAWHRYFLPGVWPAHIHAIAVGDPELSAGAESQVRKYYANGDGLAGTHPDNGPSVEKRVYPNVILNRVNMLVVYSQFTKKKPGKSVNVMRVQWVLNEKLGTKLPIDGVAGPKTRAAYAAWEKKSHAPSADGKPGRYSLKELGKGRFTVTFVTWDAWRKRVASRNKK